MKLYVASLCELTDELYNKYYFLASEERKKSIDRMRIENDKKRSILGEMLARRGISEICGIPEEKILFARTEKGKPFCRNADIYFSISHSKDCVACVIDEKNIGIDVEYIRPVEMRVTRIACTDSDREYIFGKSDIDTEKIEPNDEILKRFFTVWTAKEAYFKFLGTGIEGLRTVSYKELIPNTETICKDGKIVAIYKE